MYKQALVRCLDRQQVADLLVAKLHGDSAEGDQTTERSETVGVYTSGEDFGVWGRGDEGCQWVDDIIAADDKIASQRKREAMQEETKAKAQERSLDEIQARGLRQEGPGQAGDDLEATQPGKRGVDSAEHDAGSESDPSHHENS